MRDSVKLELRCPHRVNAVTVDPDPDWSFDALVSELNALEKKLSTSYKVAAPFTKPRSGDFYNATLAKPIERSPNPFVMRILDDDQSDDGEVHDQSAVAVKRFCSGELYPSDGEGSDNESTLEAPSYLMEEGCVAEGALLELTHEHHLGVQEEIRNQLSVLETNLTNESQKFTSAFVRVEKYQEARREVDKKLDTQYQRKIAEALDNHLTAIQRDHELRSQIEERKIRSDAAFEEARRRERALQEEKLRQEKYKAEAEAKLRADEAKRASEEAERKAAKEAAEKEAAETSKTVASGMVQEQTVKHQIDATAGVLPAQPSKGASDRTKKISTGNVLRAAESGLSLEQGRLQKLQELDERNQALRSTSNKDFSSYERRVARFIKQITATKESVRAKANEIIKIFNDPLCPQSISIAAFAKKVVCESPDNAAFACGHVVVLVTSQVPQAMDLVLAEFHRACIYTVPKHISYSESAFESKEAYYKTIGFRENEGKIESKKDYFKRLESYMRLYGALVQTEVPGVQNTHGLKEGWAWLARFLNNLPPNKSTAVALDAFLQTAGFALFRKYKSQFIKILNIISNSFLGVLKAREDSELKHIVAQIQSYLEEKKFLQEPKGRSLQSSLLSNIMAPDSNHQDPYGYGHQNRYVY